ncbi:hypothetical protein KJ562_02685 [Patescibacteria group bacterium]|nr:hypothetical protein [Patescibacteria group bacterium]MBU4162214.1 hypothetical protein [Patescibacteria group bacterium]
MGNTVGRQFYLSKQQKEIIFGCLLGDGRLESRSLDNTSRLRIHHGWKQRDRDKFRLRFPKQEAAKLINIISSHIIPSMRYKIVPVETSQK